MNRSEQIQETKLRKQTTFSKAQVIAASRHIHKSSASNIWMVESDSVKGKFYTVQYVDVPELGRNELICDCPAYMYGMTVPCKHIYAVAVRETS